jgi:hypothetical protein
MLLSLNSAHFYQNKNSYKESTMKKIALFAFNGDPMCFVHVLLNALDMKNNDYEVKVIIEGTATKLVEELADAQKPFANLYKKVKEQGLIDCVCKACAAKTGSLDAAVNQNLPLGDDMSGHPSMTQYIEKGFDIITF